MGIWSVDGHSKPGTLHLRLEGAFPLAEMQAFVDAHNRAIDDFKDATYRVFCDIRGLTPLSPEAAAVFEIAKAYSAAHANFQGSAVLVASTIVAMQHRRTSASGGVIDTELISAEEATCWEHLAKITRQPRPRVRPPDRRS
jgi:hypothetical protein